MILPDGIAHTFPSLAATAGQTAGTLDIVTTGRVSVQGMTAADPVPAGLTVNSCAVRFTADGTLEPYYDVAIAAHGDMVPDGAANAVAIMTEGSGGADTIELASTSVKSLLHFCGVDAEIAIGSGRTLAAETITLARSSGNLNVGSANDAGSLAGGPGGTLTLKNTDPESVLSVNANIAAGTDVRVDGNTGPIQLAGGAAAHPTIHISDGELRLTGEKPFYLGETFVGTNSSKALTATLKIDGAKNVVIGEDPLNVGSCLKRAWPQASVGRLIVTNSVVCNSDITASDESPATTNRAICVGLRWYGEMEIHAGAVITNRLHVGAVYNVWTEAAGAVRQYGGEMAVIGGKAANRLNSMIGSSYGNGYYELNGGKFSMLGSLSLGHYGAGSFVQYGGHSVFTDHPLSTETTRCGPLAMGNGGSATMRFVGGTSEIHNKLTLTGGETNHGRSRVTVEDTAYVDAGTHAVKITGTTTSAGTWTNTADLVVCNGGTRRSSGFYCGYSASSKPGFRQVYTVGFNDGTLKLSASDGDICYRLTTSGATRAMTNTVIYAGGMTLDTDGKTGNYAGSPFKGAWGGGVVSVPCSPITKIIAAPIVDIKGDGFGATAVAEFDSASGTMTGVKVVAPGVGYTKATALIYKTRDSYTTVDCVIAPNENTGSFTKKGDGDFSLNAANTWGGQTILEGGTLRLGVTGALPAGSTVVYNGGALAVANGVTLDSLTVSLPKISPDERYTLATFEGSAPGAAPAVTIEGVSDPRWQARIGGHKLLLSYTKGTVLVFR